MCPVSLLLVHNRVVSCDRARAFVRRWNGRAATATDNYGARFAGHGSAHEGDGSVPFLSSIRRHKLTRVWSSWMLT